MMHSTGTLSAREQRLLLLLTRTLLVIFSFGVGILVASAFFLLGSRVFYAGRALPGVNAAGVELGGQSQPQIEVTLSEIFHYPEEGQIVLRDGANSWVIEPAALGVAIDTAAMARQALQVGRQGSLLTRIGDQLDTWTLGAPIAPIILFDEIVAGFYLQGLAESINQPVVEAALSVVGDDIHTQSGQVGRELDLQATLARIRDPVHQMHDAEIDLVIVETPPRVLDAAEQAEVARTVLSQPLTLKAEGAAPWILEPSELAKMLRFTLVEAPEGAFYDVRLDAAALGTLLEPLVGELEREPANARFIFNDETRELDLLEPAIIGRSLDVEASIRTINAGINAGLHEIGLTFRVSDPKVSDEATAEELGITEAVSVVSTYFNGSSAERIQNIKTASGAFHGLLLAPGDTLSMAEVLGDISLDTGYAEALIIFGDRTIKGVGGGVCQVSTTLFRAAFFGGYMIDERHSHAYRVGYYEQGPGSPGPGLDATVFVPMVDFRFTNDSANWLLLETYVYGNQLLWKFYSTTDGRTVEWSTNTSNKVAAPKPLYRENPDLEKGEIEQIDYEADGLDVSAYRTVTRGDETLHEDVFKTHYLPWRAIFEFGPGTKLPPDVEVAKD
jgi:vancomycin resistance protein YoaR